MHSVAKLITHGGGQKLDVLSAVTRTTNSLVDIADKLSKNQKDAAKQAIAHLFEPYAEFIDNLYSSDDYRKKGSEVIKTHRELLESYLDNNGFGDKETRIFLAQGELISTQLFQLYLEEQKYSSVLLPALDFMKIDEDNEPVLSFTEDKLGQLLKINADKQFFVTQGYICLNSQGEIDNLKRGGSDYTASLIGSAARAEEIQIWTDIDGMHNNDPRVVKKTYPIAELSFDEAAELAYFGAKILHPATILPAKKYNIPVKLLNTMQPEAKGTTIATNTTLTEFKAIAAKDGIIAVKVKSSRMLLAYGFLRRVFEIFEKYKTPIDMITTSEVAVSVTIDEPKNLEKIVEELKDFGLVEIDRDQTIVCIVGDFPASKGGVARKIFEALEKVPLRMISYGGSKNNVSVLISTEHKNAALNALNEGLFNLR
jgi:aspartate kinase